MRVAVVILFTLLAVISRGQSFQPLDSLVKEIDNYTGDIKSDTLTLYRWNASTGRTNFTTVAEIKRDNSSKKPLRIAFKNDQEFISFYYRNGRAVAAKVHSSVRFPSWNGKSVNLEHTQFEDIIISDPDDQSESNVSQLLASDGHSWLKHFVNVEKSK